MVNSKSAAMISALVLSLGIFGAGFVIGKALYKARLMNRIVTVKGIAERNVKADLGIWELNYREISNNLIDANKRLQHDQELVVAYLKQHGFTDQEINTQPVKVEDKLANAYNQQNSTPADANTNRYVATSGVRVRSAHVDMIQQNYLASSVLLQQGVPLAFESSSVSPNPSYYFSGLDKIRPEMMAEATRSARTVAEQFASDSDSSLGNIQRAAQGVFQVMDADSSTLSSDWNSNESALGTINKKVRLVTTIDYRLR